MMSEQPDENPKPFDIDVIRNLLRQLEDVAAKDADKLIEVTPTQSATVPTSELASLSRTGAPSTVGAPELPLIVPQLSGQVVPVATPSPPSLIEHVEELRGHRGLAVAALSFGLGVATALGVLLVFGPLGQWQGSGRTASGPAIVASASPPAPVQPAPVQPAPVQPAPVQPAAVRVEPPSSAATADLPATSSPPVAAERSAAREPTPASAMAEPAPAPAPTPAPAPVEVAVMVPAPSVVLPSEPPLIDPPVPVPVPVRAAAAVPRPLSPPASPPAVPRPPAGNALTMPDRVALRAGEVRAAGLRLEPAPGSDSSLLIVIRNVPGWLTFSKGGAIGNGVWFMPAHAAEGLEWIVAAEAEGTANVRVQLAAADGRTVAETETAVAVSRVLTPQPAPMLANQSQRTEQEQQRLLAQGSLLIDTGEIEAARTLLRSAAEAGSVAAALKLAETYDPAQMPRLGMAVASADPLLAVRWYVHAEALGSNVATARLAALGRR